MSQSYRLVCRGCAFERAVEGLDPALDWMRQHKTRQGDEHSVDVYSFAYLSKLAADGPPMDATPLERRAMEAVVETATGPSVDERATRSDERIDDEGSVGDGRSASDDRSGGEGQRAGDG